MSRTVVLPSTVRQPDKREREGGREIERQRQRDTDRQTERHTDRQRHRETERASA